LEAVFVVQHFHKFEDNDQDVKFIGVYTTSHLAERAVKRLRTQPGFRDTPDGFRIDRYRLDHDHWVEGYEVIV